MQISEKFTYLDKVITELKSENKSLRNKALDSEKAKRPAEADKLHCDYCDFQTSSKQGLRTHMKRKHTTFDS